MGLGGLAFSIAMASAPSATAAEFKRLAQSVASDFYMDSRSINGVEAIRTADILIVSPDDTDEYVGVEIRRIEFDCTARESRRVSARWYDHDMHLINEVRAPLRSEAIQDGSVGADLWGFVCRGELPRNAGTQIYRSARAAIQASLREYRE